ncbi:InlB B-repeat-containing protein, partial [Finegoldia magna]
VKYVADDSLDFEEKVVDKAPVDGEKEVTTVSQPGEKDKVTEEVTKEPVDGVTKVGNKKVETKTNDDGSTTTTTTIYEVNPETGELINPTTTTVTTPAEEYQAIFNGNGGTPTTQKITVKDGEVVSGVEKPTREGYKFVKWVKLGTDKELDLSKPLSKDILGGEKSVIFTAVWGKVEEETPAEEYQAIFNGNGGTPTTQKVTVKDGEVVSGVTEPTREGYKFVKWVKLGTNEEIDLSKPFSKDILGGEKSVIFTAVWEKVEEETPAEEYQAIFNGNGGTPTTQKITVKDGEVISGVTKPTREGYKFVKWVKLGTNEEIDLSKPFSKDILGGENSVIFTAVWEKVVSEDTQAPTIDAGNITAVEGQPIPPVLVDVDDVNATVTVEGLPEGLKYNPETKQIEG